MQRLPLANLLFCVLLMCSCSEKPKPSPEQATKMLVGNYVLHVGSDCMDAGIEFAKLTLRPDGKYSQEGAFKSGVTYDIEGKHWSYNLGNVWLEDLRTTRTGEISSEAGLVNASLLVEYGERTAILLNPDRDCFFAKTN